MPNQLTGKSVVISGATSGIGLAAVQKFVSSGAFVIGLGRSEERNSLAKETVLTANPGGSVMYLPVDLASQSQIIELGKEINRVLAQNHFSQLDVLVNNAGVYLEMKQMTVEGIEKTFAVNHLAPFLLTNKLFPLLSYSINSRVIMVSSYSHRTTPLNLNRIANPWPYIGLLAYKRSKLCNILFANALNQKFDHIKAYAVDPGLVNTDIASKHSKGISHLVWRNHREKGTPPGIPAETLLSLAGVPPIDPTQSAYIKNGKVAQPSRNAQRDELANKLWALSCQLTSVEWG